MSFQPQQQQPMHGRTRLEVELEFVQCLANPFYLNYLSHTKVLDDERFISYIEYLEYFREPEYSKLLTYPVYSLQALTLLKQPPFRADIANPALAQEMMLDMVQSFLPADRAAAVPPRAADPVATPLDHNSSHSNSTNNRPNNTGNPASF